MEFHEKLRFLMKRNRERGVDLAEAMGIHESLVSRWIARRPPTDGKRRRPTLTQFEFLAIRYGVPCWMLRDDGAGLPEELTKEVPVLRPLPRSAGRGDIMSEIARIVVMLGPERALRRLINADDAAPPIHAEPIDRLTSDKIGRQGVDPPERRWKTTGGA